MNKYAKIHQNNPNSSNVMRKAKWIYNFFSSCVAHVKKSPFFAQTDERICHLSSLPTRNKYWAIFRLSICKAKILNGCKSCSGVIVGHLPPMFSNHFYPCYPRTNKINFSLRFFISKESVFSRGNFNFLKRHSWLDNWIDSPLIRSPFVYFCQIKGEIVTWKMRRLMGSHFWILCASCVSDIIAF